MLGISDLTTGQHSTPQARPVKRSRNAFDDDFRHHVHGGQGGDEREHYPHNAHTLGIDGKKLARMNMDVPPQAGATATPRPPDKDKNRRLSCKECRRLKLKCDRIFPCQSCVKRGCGSLCPEGALTSGRGSRFILANTGQLHEKITVLSDRVRDLEDALRTLQSSVSNQPHPLLTPELLHIKTSQDLYITPQPLNLSGSPTVFTPPTPAPAPDPQQPQHSPTVTPTSGGLSALADSTSALSLAGTQPPYTPIPDADRAASDDTGPPPDVPPDILQLSSTFPFPWSVDLRIRKRIREALPPQDEALRVCEKARKNALWQYHLDASETFLENLLHHVYATPIENLSPRRLALLLMVLSVGSLVDLNRPAGSLYGEAYHHLARAAVCEIPLMEEPDFDVLHALFFMVWWHLVFSDNKKAVGYAWNLIGFVAKLAQGLGLHRDNPRLRGIPEEDEKRRAVFWELLNLDARMSLSLGRPPSLCLRHVEAKPPAFVGAGLYVPREEIIYHEWKNAFFIQCLTPVLEAVVVVEPPAYTKITELDAFLRNFRIPKILDELQDAQEEDAQGTGVIGFGPKKAIPRFLAMQRALVTTSRDIALLQLHRRYFMEAISRPETFDLHHQYAPSVLATCLAAASLIVNIETLFEHEPQLSARFLYFWFNTYAAAAALALFVARAPATPFAPDAQLHVDKACRLFARAAQVLPLCRKLFHGAEKMAEKSRHALKQYKSGAYTGRQGSSESTMQTELPTQHEPAVPTSFHGTHPCLVRYIAQQRQSPVRSSHPAAAWDYRNNNNSDDEDGDDDIQGPMDDADKWLPDIYRHAGAGVSKELRYSFPFPGPPPITSKAPFVPGAPRVNENEEFNFDHGALNLQCEDTGYMAWF